MKNFVIEKNLVTMLTDMEIDLLHKQRFFDCVKDFRQFEEIYKDCNYIPSESGYSIRNLASIVLLLDAETMLNGNPSFLEVRKIKEFSFQQLWKLCEEFSAWFSAGGRKLQTA